MAFEVLAAVRQFYQQFGHSPATRPLIKFLMKLSSHINAVLQQKLYGLVARHLSRWQVFLNQQIVYKFYANFLAAATHKIVTAVTINIDQLTCSCNKSAAIASPIKGCKSCG